MTGTLAIIRGMSPPHRPETETSRAEALRALLLRLTEAAQNLSAHKDAS